MRAIVTGGAGFVGQHLVRRLVRDGHQVAVLDARTRAATAFDELVAVGVPVVHGSVLDVDALRPLVAGRRFGFGGRPVDVVLHLAAESHVDESLRDPLAAYRTNADGTHLVALECAAVGVPLVYCSTDEVYGDLADDPGAERRRFHERDALRPSSPYSAGKAAGELAVQAVVRSFGLRAVVTRGCNAFGAGQLPEKLVPIACRLLQRGEPVPLHGGGAQVRQWISVEEFVHGLLLAAGRVVGPAAPARLGHVEAYNLAGADRCTVREVVLALAEVAGVPADRAVVDVPDRPGQDRAYGVDGSKAERLLGLRPSRRLRDRAELSRLLAAYPADGEVAPTLYASAAG